jgi:hypothetical protein
MLVCGSVKSAFFYSKRGDFASLFVYSNICANKFMGRSENIYPLFLQEKYKNKYFLAELHNIDSDYEISIITLCFKVKS